MLQKLFPEPIAHRRQAHRRAGMARVGLLHAVHRECADGVDAKLVERLRLRIIQCYGYRHENLLNYLQQGRIVRQDGRLRKSASRDPVGKVGRIQYWMREYWWLQSVRA